ncbi:hypothetical protein J2W49_002796 [Hydrogenophaga palleronii]|uniref:Uncharacterized protein n=1 Tax=Hydrogenophaga palleronii TaxID=65655 RepID=A0ABU1WNJ2_9BURK|nr:hypothetical protein [Hydrogenophaga palleronii]MDR7150833.1 hypothetical protein [Hydrogenophaga palleronii]
MHPAHDLIGLASASDVPSAEIQTLSVLAFFSVLMASTGVCHGQPETHTS